MFPYFINLSNANNRLMHRTESRWGRAGFNEIFHYINTPREEKSQNAKW